jgi:hypothetical protein
MRFTHLAFMSIIASACLIASDPKATEIVIVGTVHSETQNYTSANLCTIIKRVHPNVILCEYDSSFFTKDFAFVRLFGGLEETAICTYMKIDSVLLRPYDIEGRNQFYREHNTFQLEDSFYQTVSSLAKEKKFDRETQEILTNVRNSFSKRDKWGKADPRQINSFECDKELAEKWYAVDVGYSEIIRRTQELQSYRDFHSQNRTFELQRNAAMVRNIERLAQEFQGKRLLVVCGFEHRHYLKINLIFSQSSSFTVKEYWEYPEVTALAN